MNIKLEKIPRPDIQKLIGFLPFSHQVKQVAPTPQVLPEVIYPVVVVPGFLGSWPSAFAEDGGKLDPITGIYTNLIEGLERIGYVQGVSLFAFPYDWRLGLKELGMRLGREIKRIQHLSSAEAQKRSTVKVNYSKVDLLGHSMGGLVCRAYIQSNAYAGEVSRLALVATPNFGAVAAYYGYEGGETSYIGVPTANAKSMIGLLEARECRNLLNRMILTYRSVRGQAKYDMQAYLSQRTTAVRDLLPLGRANYLYSRNEVGEEKIYPFGSTPGYPVNTILERMNLPEQLARLDGVEQIYCFYSNAHNTRRRILVEDRYNEVSPLYQHGFPLNPQPAESFAPGDTIVTQASACFEFSERKPDGTLWQVEVVNVALNTITGKALDHVQIVGDPDPVRYLLGYLAQRTTATPITPDIWDGLSLAKRKPNYLPLFV
ncbi:MAG: hypothetical protein WCS37_15145 [Chloroflexota bacterium]|nr:hypothetical protein [Chloroflexota bacterium]